MLADTTIKKGYKQTELGVIPEDWEVKKLGEIGKFKGGSGFPIKYQRKIDGEYPFYKVSDMNNDGNQIFMQNSNNWIDKNIRKVIGANVFPRHSIAFAKIGAAIFLERKKILSRESCMDNNMMGFIFDENQTDYRFLHYLFLNIQLGKLVSTTALPSLNGKEISELNFAFPKKEEQTAIATVLSGTDTLIEYLEKLIAKKKAIKQGTMQQLLTGKKRLPGFNGEWEVKKLGEIGETYGGLSGKTKNDFDKGDYPYIPFMNIMSNPVIDLQYFDYVNIRSDEKQNKAIKGDLFFNGSSETPEEVVMCSVLQADIPSLYLNSFCFGFRLNKNLKTDGLYLSYFFRSPIGRHLIFSLAQGATRYNLSKINFMSLEIPYPEPTEQTAIAAILSDMDSEIESLEQKRDKYTMLKQGMMQQLLTGRTRIYVNN